MKTVKILKNIELTLPINHNYLNVGQYFKSYYTNVDTDITVTKIHKQIETTDNVIKYLIDAIEVK